MGQKSFVALGLVVGACIGVAIGWWTERQPVPWMRFETLQASYVLDSRTVRLTGQYEVTAPCHENHLIWRTEVLATDNQIALYGPKAPAPLLTEGVHAYSEDIMLQRPILEDGWVARAIITCPEEQPDTVVSPGATVKIVEP